MQVNQFCLENNLVAFVAVVGCAVRRVSAPGIALANAQMGQLVAGTAAAGGWQIADGQRRGARGQVVAGGGIGTH